MVQRLNYIQNNIFIYTNNIYFFGTPKHYKKVENNISDGTQKG